MRYRFEGFEFDPETLCLSGPDGGIPLRPMTLRVLHALLVDAPQLVRHEQLLDTVWGRQAVSQGVVAQSIRELRQALGDSAQQPRIVETRHRLGYRFIAELTTEESAGTVADSAPRAAAVPDLGTASAGTAPSSRRRWPLGVALAALAVLLAAWLVLPKHGAVGASALDEVEVVHEGRPQEPQALAWYLDGLQALRDGELDSARQLLERSLAREPEAVATLAALGEAFAQSGQLEDARKWAAAALAAGAGLPRTGQLRLQALDAGLAYRWDAAEEALQALFQLDPGDAESGFRLAEAQLAGARLPAAESTLARLEALPLPGRHRFRTALLGAKLATARGAHHARLEHAGRAAALAETPSDQLEAGIELAWGELLSGDAQAARERTIALRRGLEPAAGLAGIRIALLEATLDREAGQLEQARNAFSEAAEAARGIGQDALSARAEREAAYAQMLAGEPAAAAAALGQISARLREQGDVRELASALDVYALALQRSGDAAASQAASESALAAYLEAGDQLGEAKARLHLGTLFARTGRMDEAREHWDTAHARFSAIGDRRGAATTLGNLAILHGHQGRTRAAREANLGALEAFRALGTLPEVARIQFNLGLQDRSAGELGAARERFEEARAAFAEIGAGDFLRQATATLAELHLTMADRDAAERLLVGIDDDPSAAVQPRAALIAARARLAAVRGDFESAESGFGEAHRLRAEAGLAEGAALNALDLAELAARRGRFAEAEQRAREVRRAMLDAGNAPVAVQAGTLVASILAARGQREPAARLLETLEDERQAWPDALQALRIDLVRAAIREDERVPALRAVALSARSAGFELLAQRAEQLGGDAPTLAALGEAQPPLPY